MDLTFRTPFLGVTCLCASLTATAASADGLPAEGAGAPAPAETGDATHLPGMLITGDPAAPLSSPKYTEPLLNIPQTVTVIPREVMDQQGAVTLRDVLRNVPGISIQAGEGGVPNGDNLSVRGFSARSDLFVDGVRDFGGYTRDAFNTEQVEVVKGPASTYSGRGSTGGSVNLSTKVPRLERSYDGTVGLGTERYERLTLDLNQPIPDSPVRGTAARFNALWTSADVANRDEVESARWGVAPTVAMGLGTDSRLTLSYVRIQENSQPDYGIPWVPANTNAVLASYSDRPAPVDFSNYYGLLARDYERTGTDVATAKAEHDFNDSVSLRLLTRYGETRRDSVITAPRFVNANLGSALNRQLQSRDQTDTLFAQQADLRVDFESGPVEHEWVTGVEYIRETSENFARAQSPSDATPLADLYTPDPRAPFQGTVMRTGASTDTLADSVALTTFDTLRFGERWQVSGGVRWDLFDVDYRAVATNGVATPLSRTDSMVSGRAGVVYKPAANGSVYAAFGTSFNPSAEGLTLGTGATAANNLNLDPEQSRSYEIGTKWDVLDRRLALSVALFRTEKTNARTEDPTDSTDVVVLDGEQRVQGVEVGITGRLTTDWTVFAGYAFMDSEVTASRNAAELGRELSNTPQQTFSLWSTWKLPWDFEVGGGARFVDSRFTSTANTREAPAYWLFDAMLGCQMNKHVSLRLNVQNLADEDYIDRVGGGHFVPGAGRTGTLTAAFDF